MASHTGILSILFSLKVLSLSCFLKSAIYLPVVLKLSDDAMNKIM